MLFNLYADSCKIQLNIYSHLEAAVNRNTHFFILKRNGEWSLRANSKRIFLGRPMTMKLNFKTIGPLVMEKRQGQHTSDSCSQSGTELERCPV